MSWKPWNDYPGLVLDRLLTVGGLIRSARDSAADDHRPEMYEGNWSLGVRGYERTCGALTWATQTYDWLTVVSGAGGGPVHFVLSITGHAVRFYHGSPENVPERYRQASFPELLEQQRALELDGDLPLGRSLRIAIENDDDGRPDSIYLVEVSEDTGLTTNTYLIPLPNRGTVAPFGTTNDPPTSIPPVSAEPVDDRDEGSAEGTKTGSNDE